MVVRLNFDYCLKFN